MFNTPPAPKGFDDKDDGPHAIDAPMNQSNFNTKMTIFAVKLIQKVSFKLMTVKFNLPASDCPALADDAGEPMPTVAVETRFPVDAYLQYQCKKSVP